MWKKSDIYQSAQDLFQRRYFILYMYIFNNKSYFFRNDWNCTTLPYTYIMKYCVT